MSNASTNLVLRNDTILGVCEAIGRDFGFNPLWLRLAFIAPIFIAPMVPIIAYLGLGVVVGLTNLLVADQQKDAPQLAATSGSANADVDTSQAMSLAA